MPSGSMYAIVGASGAGKSTIINMIPRLYDVLSGSVKISGCDVRSFDLEYLRRNIGTVTQDTYLFNGTIMDNLLYAKENATKEEIEDYNNDFAQDVLWELIESVALDMGMEYCEDVARKKQQELKLCLKHI